MALIFVLEVDDKHGHGEGHTETMLTGKLAKRGKKDKPKRQKWSQHGVTFLVYDSVS